MQCCTRARRLLDDGLDGPFHLAYDGIGRPEIRDAGFAVTIKPTPSKWCRALNTCQPDGQAPDQYCKDLWAFSGAHLPRLRSCGIVCGRRQESVPVVVRCVMMHVWQAFGFRCLATLRSQDLATCRQR